MRPDTDHPRAVLGRCPDCDATISSRQLLIEYESADGRPAMYAECPGCLDVVHPT